MIGAGVIGASTALELAKTGRRVLVVDKLAGPGQGSTSASSAVVRFNYSTLDGVATAWESMHHWADWAGHLGRPAGDGPLASFMRTGLVMLEVPVAPMDRVLAMFDAVGVPYEVWDAAELAARVPGIDTGRYWPPKRLDDDGVLGRADGNPRRVLQSRRGVHRRSAARRREPGGRRAPRGSHVRFQAAGHRRQAGSADPSGGRVAGLDLAGGERVDAPVIVNVGGPWSSALNRLAGVGEDFTISVRPMRQEVHHVPAPPGFNSGDRLGPVVADLDLGVYVRGTPGDGMLIGGTEPDCDSAAVAGRARRRESAPDDRPVRGSAHARGAAVPPADGPRHAARDHRRLRRRQRLDAGLRQDVA